MIKRPSNQSGLLSLIRICRQTVAGANASANLYPLVQTCKANGVDPYRYLRALFIALPNATTVDDYEELLPWRIALAAQ